MYTLNATEKHGIAIIEDNIIRHLTPIELERLQGFPDNWTNVENMSDNKRYKMLGNSLCLPFWDWLSKKIVTLENVKTVGSLFSGIGGFELVFQNAGAQTLWSSEIDIYCKKVISYHFPCEIK